MKEPLVKPPNAPKRLRGGITALAVIAGLAFAGLLALRLLTATSQTPAPTPPSERTRTAQTKTLAVVSDIPEPEPLPNLDVAPSARPLVYTLIRDPFPVPPPPPPAPPSTTARRPAPPLPPANPIALFVEAKKLRYVGYVAGTQPIGTFGYAGDYLVMFEGGRFPNSDVSVTKLTTNHAVLSDTTGRRYVLPRNQ